MIRKLFLFLTLCVVLNASVYSKVENLLGSADYNRHKNLIDYTLKNNSYYDSNNTINYVKLTSALQNNGLLKLGYGTTRYIDVTFVLSDNPKLSLKILKDVLKSMGHYYYFTQEAVKSNNSLRWKINLKTAAAINPLRLSQLLQDNGCRVVDIVREGSYNWVYSINTNNASIDSAEDLINSNSISVKNSTKPYLVKVSSANALNISSNSGNRWYPNIVFYDDAFKVIETYKNESLHKNLRVDVPNSTKYIKIDDLYTLANLRRGLNITKE